MFPGGTERDQRHEMGEFRLEGIQIINDIKTFYRKKTMEPGQISKETC